MASFNKTCAFGEFTIWQEIEPVGPSIPLGSDHAGRVPYQESQLCVDSGRDRWAEWRAYSSWIQTARSCPCKTIRAGRKECDLCDIGDHRAVRYGAQRYAIALLYLRTLPVKLTTVIGMLD
jgi:hypothetical protein